MEDIILLAEGCVEDAETALRSFNRNGLANQIRVAGDGPEVLDFLLSRREGAKRSTDQPILILLDLALPIISGLDVLKRIKTDSRIRRIPVALLASSEPDVHRAMKLGADCLIEKPVTFDKLLSFATQVGIRLSRKDSSLDPAD